MPVDARSGVRPRLRSFPCPHPVPPTALRARVPTGPAAAGVFEFRSDRGATDLDRGDFEVVERLSRIVVHNSDGSSFQVR